ncbi:hypothetical protein TI03_02535 [Achromatium sp. WMS1]|nr:hypothetical protein TI03_02535 [Achromatium sp. WMS1]
MRKILLAVSIATVSSFAFAAEPGGVQFQSTSGGVNIAGNTTINAGAHNTTTTATEGSIARSATGSIRGGTNIAGNTSISAYSQNTTTTASGGSIATTSVGTIGGE